MSSPSRPRRAAAWCLPLVALGVGAAAPAGAAPRPAEFVPDLEAQFDALNVRADALGLNISTTPDPSSCKHYQGIARVQGADGTPYMIVTRSGNTPSFGYIPDGWLCDDSPGETGHGNLIVFRMGSRDKDGERLRSNRLQKNRHVDATPPHADDVATIFYTTTEHGLVFRNGTAEDPANRVYGHPGGMQVVGNILAVAFETPYSSASPESLVMFLDVTDPESPIVRSTYAPIDVLDQPISAAGTLGIARMPDGHFLMAITGGKNNTLVNFFRSSTTDLASESLDWIPIHRWVANIGSAITAVGLDPDRCPQTLPGSIMGPGANCLSPDEQYLGQNWPDGNDKHTHQTLQFLRDGSIDGTLYLVGARGRFMSDDTGIDLYRVDCETVNCDSGPIRLKHVRSRELWPYPIGGGEKLVSFAAATGFYVSPGGELLLYGAEHDNDGPDGTVKAGEWRNRHVVRPGSPTLQPTATVSAPATVDEGSAAPISGTASGPTTQAFLQLFHQTSYGSYSLVADHRDRDLDDFDNLYLYELQILPFQNPPYFQHSDKARSWTWHAPAGCSIQALDREDAVLDEVRTLTQAPGEAPEIQYAPDLSLELNDGNTDDINAEIDGIQFLPDCGDYYSTPFQLSWDLDGNGTFEGTGSAATFSAATLDGPSQVAIAAQSQSPYGGATGTATATISIVNVPPRITEFVLRDSLGQRVGIDVPFAILGLPLTAAGSFVDPGRPDTQTARLDWGDGTVEANGVFAGFQDAFGGRVGGFTRARRYAAAGDYFVTLGVTDDDGGTTSAQAFVSVLSPTEAVRELIATLDEKIAATTDDTALRALRMARLYLAGGADGLGAGGALDKLTSELRQAAIVKLRLAISALQEAGAAGGNVSTEIALLRLVLASLGPV